MKKLLGILLTFTLILSSITVPLTGAAADVKAMTEKDGVFSIEAESTTINLNYEKGDDAQASGGKYLSTNLDSKEKPAKTDKGNLEFAFTPTNTGKHYFWARINPSKPTKYIWLAFGDQEFTNVKLSGVANTWSWVMLKEFDAEAGKATTVKFNTNIGYFKVDVFEISSDASYAPAGASAPAATPAATTTPAAQTSMPSTPAKDVLMEQKGGAAFIEAEKASINNSDASEASDAAASGGKIVNLVNDRRETPDQSDSGAISFTFTPDADGTYAFWARVKPTSPNKSLWFAVGDTAYADVALKGEKGAYRWAGITCFEGKKGEKVTVKIKQQAGYFAVDCFVIGANAGSKVYTPDDKTFGVSGSVIGNAPVVKTPSKGAYPLIPNNIDKMANGVALLVDNANAYTNKKLQKVDAANDAVVPMVKNDRTLVPLRFIAESFGAKVGWDEVTQTASVSVDSKNISITLGKAEMTVDGNAVALDVAAETINDRTMLPLRAVVESLGKNVFWDDRGLILITNKDTTIDKTADKKMVSIMLGYLKTGKLALDYAVVPHFSQSVIDNSAKIKAFKYTVSSSQAGSGAANALYYLTLAAGTDENIAATDGTLAKDAALTLLRSLIAGGNEPICSYSAWWSHPIVAADLLLIKNTPAIYDTLTQDEKDRMDFLQKCLAIAGNWGFNDANNYGTGFDMRGNSGKSWNPNHRNYLFNVVMAAMYFGPEELDKTFTSFSYDEYMTKIKAYGFTNIEWAWSAAGKNLMENGGDAVLVGNQGINNQKAGDPSGTGKGVKLAFKYMGLGLDNIEGIFEKFIDAAYKGTVVNGFGTDCYMVTGADSPMLGYEGMMYEFAAGDGYGIRSKAGYCFDSFMFLMPVLANLKMFGKWDSLSAEQRKYDAIMYTGNTDFIFKSTQGYQGYSNGSKSSVEYESSFVGAGYMISKDLWVNFHNIENEDITIAGVPGLAEAEPYNGVTEPADGAYVSSESKGDVFAEESYFDLGKKHTDDVTAEFDLVFGDDITVGFNGVLMFDQQGAKDLIWSKVNVLIQCTGSKINIRDGSKYVCSEFDFAPNYRYHFKVKMNASKQTYSVWMTPIWPKAGAEKLVADNFAFRVGANAIDNIGDLLMATEVGVVGKFWVENLKISE